MQKYDLIHRIYNNIPADKIVLVKKEEIVEIPQETSSNNYNEEYFDYVDYNYNNKPNNQQDCDYLANQLASYGIVAYLMHRAGF